MQCRAAFSFVSTGFILSTAVTLVLLSIDCIFRLNGFVFPACVRVAEIGSHVFAGIFARFVFCNDAKFVINIVGKIYCRSMAAILAPQLLRSNDHKRRHGGQFFTILQSEAEAKPKA